VVAEIHLRRVQLAALESEPHIVDDFYLVVVHVQDLLVEYVVVQQDQVFLRRALELRRGLLVDVENDLVVGNEQSFIPRNRQPRVAERPRHDDVRDLGQLAGLDDRKIAEAPDPVLLHEDRPVEYFAEVKLVLEYGYHDSALRHDQNELIDHQCHQSQKVHAQHHQRNPHTAGHIDARLAIAGVERAYLVQQVAKCAHIGVLVLCEQGGKQYGHAIQGRQHDDRHDYEAADEVLTQRVAALAHCRLVVEQQDQKHQRGREQGDGDDLHEQGDEDERRFRDEHDEAGADQHEEVGRVEPRRLTDLRVERMCPAEDLAKGPRAGEGNTDGSQQAGIEQPYGEERPDVAIGLHHHLSRLRGAVDVDARKHGPGDDDDEYGDSDGDNRAEQCVEPAPRYVLFEHDLVDDGALLEEKHPGRDRCADVGHEEKEQLAVESPREIRNQSLVQYVAQRRMHEKGAR